MAVLGDVLGNGDIPHLATIDIADPSDPSNFVGDGHFTPEVDTRLATVFLDILDAEDCPAFF